jgi:hypothetical protein
MAWTPVLLMVFMTAVNAQQPCQNWNDCNYNGCIVPTYKLYDGWGCLNAFYAWHYYVFDTMYDTGMTRNGFQAYTCARVENGYYSYCPDKVCPNTVCPAGQYLYKCMCYGCPAGTFSNVTNITSVANCLSCPAGTYSNAGQTACTTCTSCNGDQYRSPPCTSTSNSGCAACPANKYCNGINATDCSVGCPNSTYQTLRCTSTADRVCSSCPPG